MNLLQDGLDTNPSVAIVQNLGWLLIHSSWQCLLIALVVFCIASIMRYSSSSVRYWMYSLALLLMLLAPALTLLVFPQTNNPTAASEPLRPSVPVSLPSDSLSFEDYNGQSTPLIEIQNEKRIAAAKTVDREPSSDPKSGSIAVLSQWNGIKVKLRPWLTTIVAIWCCGVLVFSLRPLWGWLMVRRLLRVGTKPVALHVRQALQRVREKMQVGRHVEVFASSLIGSPIVVGCFRSVILVPASFVTNLPMVHLEAILAHELAHVQRYDYLVNLLQTLVETLLFYHPIVWWVSHRIRMERENCCDDRVVAVFNNKAEYGRALLAVEEFRSRAAKSLALGVQGGVLKKRVQRLFRDVPSDVPRRATGAWLVGGVVAVSAIAMLWSYSSAGSKRDESSPSEVYVVTFSHGTKVELVGVGMHPLHATKFWKPDGSTLNEQPQTSVGPVGMDVLSEHNRQFCYQIAQPDAKAERPKYSVRILHDTEETLGVPDLRSQQTVYAAGPFQQETTTIRMGVVREDVPEYWGRIDTQGKRQSLEEIPNDLRAIYERISPLNVSEVDAQVQLSLDESGLSQLLDRWALDLYAEVDGGVYSVSRMMIRGRERWIRFHASRKDLKGFRYRIRPYSEMGKIQNVSLKPGQRTEVKVSVERLSVGNAMRAGQWRITEDAELAITQKLVHATDVMTSGVIRLQSDTHHPRHVSLSIAMDHFANRERWKAVWEEGQPVLWVAKGHGDGPGRILPPGTRVKIDELRRIDFRNPDCVVHHVFSGWVADQLPSVDIRAALEEPFEIKPDGQEHHRYYESARQGLQPDDSSRHMFVWVGEKGNCQVEDLAWEANTGEPREVKCDLKTLSNTLALVLKKYRAKASPDVPVYAFVTSRADLPAEDLKTVLDACQENGLKTPEMPAVMQVAATTTEAVSVSPSGEIRGLLIDSQGKPVANAIVACGAIYREDGHDGGARTTTDSEGRYRLVVPSPGIYTVFLKAYEVDPKRTAAADDGVKVEAGRVTQSMLRLVEGQQVAGKALDENGIPLAGLTVMSYSAARPHSLGSVHSTTTKEDGAFEFFLAPGPSRIYAMETVRNTTENPLRMGSVDLTVSKNGADPVTLILGRRESQFGSDEWLTRSTPGTKILSRGQKENVSGTVVDEAGALLANVMIIKTDDKPVTTDAEGRFRVRMPKGTQFVMHAFHPGYHVWFGTPTAGDELKIVMLKKRSSEGTPAADGQRVPAAQPNNPGNTTKTTALEAPSVDKDANEVLDTLRRNGWRFEVPESAVIRSDTSEITVEAIDWEFALPGEGIPELRKVKANHVRWIVPRSEATAARLELQGDVIIFTPRVVLGSDKARIDVGQKRYELNGSSRLMDGNVQIRAQRMTLSDDALMAEGEVTLAQGLSAGPVIQFKAARIEVNLQRHLMKWIGLNPEDTGTGPFPTLGLHREHESVPTSQLAWLRFCPGTQIVEHTDAQFVSGVVVDEEGRPIAGCNVEEPGLAGPKTDGQGRFQYKQSMPHRTVLRAYHPEYRLWLGAPELGDEVRIVLHRKRKLEAVNGTREMTVRVIDSRTADPVPNVKVTASRYEGPQNGTVAATGVTNQDGTVVIRGLEFIQHQLVLSADQPVRYIGDRAHPGAGQEEVVMLVDRACELVLRAVDSDTGKGIAGVRFDRERELAELWASPVVNDILGRHRNGETLTDEDGYARFLVGPATWSYMILKYPEGYNSIVPIDGRQEVEIETPVGGKVEYTFRLVRTKAAATETRGPVKRWKFRVFDEATDRPVRKAQVRLTPWRKGKGLLEPVLLEGTEDGWIEFDAPEPGGGMIHVVDERFFHASLEGVKPPSDNVWDDGVWFPQRMFESVDGESPPAIRCWRGSRFLGRVQQADGKPAAKAQLNIGARIINTTWMNRMGIDHKVWMSWDHGQWPNWMTTVTTDDQGRFEVRVPPGDAISYIRVGSATLSFSAINDTVTRNNSPNSALLDHVPFMVELNREVESEGTFDAGEIQLESGVRLTGKVLHSGGVPAEGVQVWAEPIVTIRRDAYEFSPHAGRFLVTDKQGGFQFAPLRPGAVKLTVFDRRRDGDGLPVEPNYSVELLTTEVTLPENQKSVVKELIIEKTASKERK